MPKGDNLLKSEKPVRIKEKKEASIFGENENPNRNFEEKWGRNSKMDGLIEEES